ncbi:MAG: hypothetical protein AB1714_06030 [Acidobacteriota bacterium]
MDFLSEDDLNIQRMTDAELASAWYLWFTLAQTTNGYDEPYAHGCFVGIDREEIEASTRRA